MSRKPWDKRPADLKLPFGYLFHGTAEPMEGALRGGAFDSLVWTAPNPDIAQCYLPASGVRTWASVPDEWKRDDPVRPDKGLATTVLRQMGVEIREVEHDATGQAQRWVFDRRVTEGDFARYLEVELGYRPINHRHYELKLHYDEAGEHVMPADYRMPGRLYILTPPEDLRILDLAEALDGDIPTYDVEKLPLLRQARKRGFDAVWTPDQAQSRNWGNVQHYSLALFPGAVERSAVHWIPAVNFDWSPDDPVSFRSTPEFDAWRARPATQIASLNARKLDEAATTEILPAGV